MKNRSKLKAFTLLEVIIAMAMFAIVSVPALSLMSFSARKTNNQIGLSNASELKRNVVSSVKESGNAFTWDLAATPVALYANQDLSVVDYSGALGLVDADKYYRIDILEPVGYTYANADAYRVFVFKVIWPAFVEGSPGNYVSNEANSSNLEEVILTSVVSK